LSNKLYLSRKNVNQRSKSTGFKKIKTETFYQKAL